MSDERYFVDSNIWLYAFIQRADEDKRHEQARNLIRHSIVDHGQRTGHRRGFGQSAQKREAFRASTGSHCRSLLSALSGSCTFLGNASNRGQIARTLLSQLLGQPDCRGGSTNGLHYFVFRGHAKRFGFRRGSAGRKSGGIAWRIKDGVNCQVRMSI